MTAWCGSGTRTGLFCRPNRSRGFTVAEIEQLLRAAPEFAGACFDADLGYPREVRIDPRAVVADDEYHYGMSLKLEE